jgi:hypothetical protein
MLPRQARQPAGSCCEGVARAPLGVAPCGSPSLGVGLGEVGEAAPRRRARSLCCLSLCGRGKRHRRQPRSRGGRLAGGPRRYAGAGGEGAEPPNLPAPRPHLAHIFDCHASGQRRHLTPFVCKGERARLHTPNTRACAPAACVTRIRRGADCHWCCTHLREAACAGRGARPRRARPAPRSHRLRVHLTVVLSARGGAPPAPAGPPVACRA